MPKRTYRLPDYSTTHDENKWYRAWSSIWEPIEKALGVKCYGFDPYPGFSLIEDQSQYWDIVHVPLWFAERMVAALETGRCKTCQSWICRNDESHGECTSVKFVNQSDIRPARDDELQYGEVDGHTGAWFTTGPRFGCRHWQKRTE